MKRTMEKKEITLEDLQELGRLLKGSTGRPMTEQEIAAFGTIPEGATKYQDFKSYVDACNELSKRNATYKASSNPDEGLFWTLEK